MPRISIKHIISYKTPQTQRAPYPVILLFCTSLKLAHPEGNPLGAKDLDFTNVCTCAENPSTPQINNLVLSVLNVLLKQPRPSCPRKQVSDCEPDDLCVSLRLCSQLDCVLPLRLIMAGEDFWAAGVNGTKQNPVANYMFRTIYQILHLHSATTLIVHAKLLLGLSL